MISLGKKKSDFLLLVFFSIFPIAILVGNFAINLFILILGIIFLLKLLNNKEIKINKLNFFLLTFFFISLCINLIFTDNFSLSYQRVLKFFFVILFIFSFDFIIKNHHKELKNIFGA